MLTLGDFFLRSGTTRPVSPREVKLTAVCKDPDILPGGQPNPSKKQVAAEVTACLVFLGGEGLFQARLATRKYLDAKKSVAEENFEMMLHYHLVHAALKEWDPAERLSGDPMFPSVDIFIKMVELPTVERLFVEYFKYVKEEHPEVLPPKPFSGPDGGGEGLAGA
jgi:hypothetical protein